MSTATHLYYRRADDQSVPMGHDLVELYFGRRGGPLLVPELVLDAPTLAKRPSIVTVHGQMFVRNDGSSIAREMMVTFEALAGHPELGLGNMHGWHVSREDRGGAPVTVMFRTQGLLHCTQRVVVATVTTRFEVGGTASVPRMRVTAFADGMRPTSWVLTMHQGEDRDDVQLVVESEP